MPFPRFKNNIIGTLSNDSGTDNYMEVDAAFITAVSDASFDAGYIATLESGSTREVVNIKAASGGQIQCDRAQEGTGTYDWPAGTKIELRATAGILNWLKTYPGKANVQTKSSAHAIQPEEHGPYSHITLAANISIDIFGLTDVEANRIVEHTLILQQDATGGRTVTWASNILWPGGTAPTLSSGANKIDIMKFITVDNTNYLGFVVGQNFS